MEYFVYLPNVGMQVFLCFQDDEDVGMEVFQDKEEVQMNVLRMWGLRRRRRRRRRRMEPSEEGTCTVLCELQGICIVACE
jgi:hypothetical protein